MLALGLVVGGLAVTGLPHLAQTAVAQQEFAARPIAGITAENMAALRALDNSFASLAQYIEPSVVKVESAGAGGADIMGRRMGAEHGIGTGVIYRPDGWIITNDHVVAGFDTVNVDLQDGRQLKASVVRRAPDNDLAVLKVDATDLPAAQFGDSGKVRPGQFAMAVGAPFNMDETVTVGHISALGREQTIPDSRADAGMRAYTDLIQTDAPINMGNSGGPLINIDGQVIGINSAIVSMPGNGGSVGLGFAIPSNQARMVADELISQGSVTRAYLGLYPKNVPEYQQRERHIQGGALADDVRNDGPAGMAGIHKDDLILRIGNIDVRNQQDVRDSMYHYQPGSTVDIELLRNGERKTVHVKLGDYKEWSAKLKKQYSQEQPQMREFQGTPETPVPDIPDIQDFGKMFRNQAPEQLPDTTPHTGHAKLGVTVESLNESNRSAFGIPNGIEGAVVTSVAPGSVAESLGIQPGTVIQLLGDKQVRTAQDVRDAMKDVNYGDTRRIKFGKYTANSQAVQDMPVKFK
jgi:serine protease Do